MFHELSKGMKASLTMSVKTTFDQYMRQIEWEDEKFSINDYMLKWQNYIQENAAWYKSLEDEVKSDPSFHEAITVKMQEVLDRILSDEPTDEEKQQLNQLINAGQVELSIHEICRMHGQFLIDKYHIKA